MLKNNQNFWPVLALVALIGASLACNLPGFSSATPTETPLSTQSELPAQVTLPPVLPTQTPMEPERLSLTLTEEELNTMILRELENGNTTQVEGAQLDLQPGQIVINGQVNQGGLLLPLELIVTVEVSQAGRPEFKVLSGNVGPFPLPEEMLDQIEAQLNEGLANNLGDEIDEMYIESVVIDERTVTISGHRR